MTLQNSITLIAASSQQESALKTLIETSGTAIFSDAQQSSLSSVLADVRLLIHKDVGEMASTQDIERGLEKSPSVRSIDGTVSLLEGANDVADELSKELSILLRSNAGVSLLVPHAYAIQKEITSLIERDHIPMCFLAGTAFYRFDATCCEPQLIRKSFGSNIAMHSVAWVFREDGNRKPLAAFVPIFDGDGWALAGFGALIFPKLRHRMH